MDVLLSLAAVDPLDFAVKALAFIVVISLVVFVHEMGHFLVARWCGVRVEVFSIGFGPELIGRDDRLGTRWKLAAVPLGGYVKFFGDADASSGRADDAVEMTEEERRVSFHHKSVWSRIAIVFAGPAANFLFAIAVFAGVYGLLGQTAIPPVVADVQAGSAAAEAGIRPGDRILAVDGRRITRFEDLQQRVPIANGAPMTLTIARDGREVTLDAQPRFAEIEDSFGETRRQAMLGIVADGTTQEIIRLGPGEALVTALAKTYGLVEATLVTLGQMIGGERGTEDLGGPLRIAQLSGHVAELGFVSLLMFTAFLSTNLGLINLFPIPVLDGGHLAFYAVEAVRGRPLDETAQEYGFRLGLVMIVGLMVFVTWNDIVRLING
ncbi:RIP metalloprotease RseP [Roseospira visakhapatnamensis]|uniref:Zinc metalloprotease n=1 Tax=Roseospira visakhapatnamensis TaxID=390880 RepID=A0A7W6W9W8_9PROT|nr:RIP metalloprotease RseP [Roseospira visakhapatnamensis]MBB4265847.1 regulator of sigma E protease [Roseospira visakhapatnamensis]